MSGGVDSAVAAAQLMAAGHSVEGITLRLADVSCRGVATSRGGWPRDAELAAGVCRQLGVPHRVLDAGALFQQEVVQPFVESYLQGETPSPCPRCNLKVKIGPLQALAAREGFAAVATGHYARSVVLDGTPALLRGRDRARDQSYFLFALSRGHLASLLLPLGDLTKQEVRAEARCAGMPQAAREDSQEICFVPPGSGYREVVAALAAERLPPPGEIVDTAGRTLGRHGGIHRYTVGQRRGLGVAAHHRLYVVAIDRVSNRVVVGTLAEARRQRLVLGQMSWLVDVDQGTWVEAAVQVRSRHEPVPGRVLPRADGTAEVILSEPVLAPAPGQAAVFYLGQRVLGGGWIVAAS